MKTEFEITFNNVAHDILRDKIKELGGVCIQEKTLMRRVVFKHQQEELKNSFFRVRDEGDKITCTYKNIQTGILDINSVQEIETKIQDFDAMVGILRQTQLKEVAYQETYRETWKIENNIYFMLDEWPGIKPFIEIESDNEQMVQYYTKKLGFNYTDGIFGAVDEIYFKENGIPHDITNNTPIITFEVPLTR